MNNIVQIVLQKLAGEGLASISKRIGADEQSTSSALSLVVPLLVSALAKNSRDPEGARSLQEAVKSDHDGSILENLGGFLNDPRSANGEGILRHVLGNRQETVTRGLARGTDLGQNQIGDLLQIAAPLIMGILGKKNQAEGLDQGSIGTFLNSQTRAVKKKDPGLMGVLNTLLDSDQDGSAIDDVIGMIGNKLKGR